MALSPIVTHSPVTATTPTRSKGLAVRNMVRDEKDAGLTPTGNGYLAEQLNENVRRKYVKGIVAYQFVEC
jgi:hypothetical protein